MRRRNTDVPPPRLFKGPALPVPRLPSQNHQSASELPHDAVFSRRGWQTAAFPGDRPGSEAMGSQEVLGQAARLASSGLLLQVLSAPSAPSGPAARMREEPGCGQAQSLCGSRYRGVRQEEVAAEMGLLGPELGACVPSPGWEIANKPFPFENLVPIWQ